MEGAKEKEKGPKMLGGEEKESYNFWGLKINTSSFNPFPPFLVAFQYSFHQLTVLSECPFLNKFTS